MRNFRRAVGDDDPVAHDDDPTEAGCRELHVVGDGHDGSSGALHRLDDGPDAGDAVGILAGRRLVEDDDRRVHGEDTCQRDQLAA